MMRARAVELGLGLRLAWTGGAGTRLRAALTATGVAIGVAMLLLAASVPQMLSAHDARVAALTPVYGEQPGQLRMLETDTVFRGRQIDGLTLQPAGSRPPLPPGLSRLPKPGTMFVSPALLTLLDGSGGAELRRRLGARVAGVIADAGLSEPDELRFVRGSAALEARGVSAQVSGFGVPISEDPVSPTLRLLVIVSVVALLLPVGMFVATTARFGGEDRDQRLAALRLLGADVSSTSMIAAGESLLGALAGVMLGGLLFLLARPVAQHVSIGGIGVFSSDIRPSPTLVALVIVLVPLSSVAVTLLGMRRVVVDPLGVSRRSAAIRRTLWWRLVPPALGFLLLVPFVKTHGWLGSTSGQIEAAAGVMLVLIGITALLPWLVESVVRRAGDGPLPWLLAVRRLRGDDGTSGRVVGAIGLAVAGAIALQMLFSAVEARSAQQLGTPAQRATQTVAVRGSRATEASVLARLRAVPGVVDISQARVQDGVIDAEVKLGPGAGDVADRLRDVAAAIDRLAEVAPLETSVESHTLLRLRHAVLAGALAVLLMIGASLLVGAVEQLRERRRVLSVLSALGTPRGTIAWSVLWQVGIPIVCGMTLAVLLGAALGTALLWIVSLPISYDWGAVALMGGAGAVIAALVTLVTLPILWRLMTPDGLRVE